MKKRTQPQIDREKVLDHLKEAFLGGVKKGFAQESAKAPLSSQLVMVSRLSNGYLLLPGNGTFAQAEAIPEDADMASAVKAMLDKYSPRPDPDPSLH